MNESEKQKPEPTPPFLIVGAPGRVRLYGLIADLSPEEARDLHRMIGATIGMAEQRGPRIVLPDMTRKS